MESELRALVTVCAALAVAAEGWIPDNVARYLVQWVHRASVRDPTIKQDLAITAIILAVKLYFSIEESAHSQLGQTSWAMVAGAAATGYVAFRWRKADEEVRSEVQGAESVEGPLQPLLFPSKTTHVRLFPEKHGFGFSYLLVGIPIGFRGTIGSLVSVDEHLLPSKRRRNGWFHVRAADYLKRGGNNVGLKEKLSEYLKSQNGINDDDWEYAYLVTAPRFLGYAFNPVSFWYIYSAELELKYMILEVNNTFDERRMYLLKGSELEEGAENERSRKFTDSWKKDFHVSPFNSRKGSYSLTALNPFTSHGESQSSSTRIDNVITLKSSKDHSKLVARIFSTQDGIDPSSLTRMSALRFVVSWWWVGFVTFPRIVREAGKLFFKRKLHVWYRPEVLNSSIGRTATDTEEFIASIFWHYMSSLVALCPEQIHVHFTSGIPNLPPSWFLNPRTSNPEDESIPKLHIRVITPEFYSRLLHYPTLAAALSAECLNTNAKNRTLSISNPLLLRSLYAPTFFHPAQLQQQQPRRTLSPRWSLLALLRSLTPPPPQAYPNPPNTTTTGSPISTARPAQPPDTTSVLTPSFLDAFVRATHGRRRDAALYRRAATRHLLAVRFAFGFGPLVDLADLLVRLGLLLVGWVWADAAVGALRRGLDSSVGGAEGGWAENRWVGYLLRYAVVNAAWLLEYVKGC